VLAVIGRGAEIHLEGLPAVRKMVAELTGRQFQNRMRKAVRAGAKPFQGELKAEAASHHGGSENLPASFTKVPAAKTSTRGGSVAGGQVEAYVRPSSPLFNVFEPGAGAHEIAPHGSRLAGPAGGRGWSAQGRKRGGAFFARGAVRHPGMAARPILPSSFAAKVGAAETAVARAIFGGGR
jgi:hypothetical protein